MMTTATSRWSKDTVAVVTGANKGIGIEFVRLLAEHGLTVVLTARNPSQGQAAVDGLKARGLNAIVFHTLDVRSSESMKDLAMWLKNEFGGIDILVNNAGIGRIGTNYEYETARDIIETNYRGVKNVTQVLLPLMRASPAGARIVNVTSQAGMYNVDIDWLLPTQRLSSNYLKDKFKDEENYSEEMVESLATKYLADIKAGRAEDEGWIPNLLMKVPAYSESKMFLNYYAAMLAKSLSKSQREDHQIFVVTFCPGLAKTSMYDAYRAAVESMGIAFPESKTAAEGADTGVWLALLPKKELAEKSGKLFTDRKEFSFGGNYPW